MKLFKKAVSIFLALLMVFGSVSLLATAADAEFNWAVDTKFYRQDGDEWIETTKAKKGETVKARIYMETDFDLSTTQLIYFYSGDFLEVSTKNNTPGSYAGAYTLNTEISTVKGDFKLGEGYDDNLFGDMVYDGFMEEDFMDDKSWLLLQVVATPSTMLDGSAYLAEFEFVVKKDATEEGQFYLSIECVSDYENWCAPSTISAEVDGEVYISCDVPTGTFACTRNDQDADSTLTTSNNVIFTAGTKVAEYTGFIGEPLASIAGFSVPTASAEGKEFLGWSLDGTTVISNDEIAAMAVGYETIELKAVFQAAEASYTLNVYEMGTDGTYPESATKTETVGSKPGTVVNATTYSVPAGFTLDAAKSSGDQEVNADGSTVVNVYLARNKYTATFGDTVVEAYYGAEYAAPAGADTETGVFEYWVNADDESVTMNVGDIAVMGLENVTYIAKYDRLYDVTYEFAGVEVSVEVPAAAKVTAGTIITPSVEIPEGYAVIWTAIGATDNGDGTFTAGANDVKFVGTWSKQTQTISFSFVGDVPDDFEGVDPVTAAYGDSVMRIVGGILNDIERPGYGVDVFAVDGAIDAPADYLVGTEPVIVTLVWTQIDYNINYKFPGVEGVDYPFAADITGGPAGYTFPGSVKQNYGEVIALPELEAAGWTFNGWTVDEYANVDGDGNYTVGETHVTVTGSWTKNTYVVNFWLDTEMTELYDSQEYYFGDEVIYPGDPTDDILPVPGTYFDGWEQDIIEIVDADTADTYFVETEPGVFVYDNCAFTVDYEYTVSVYYMNVQGYQNNVAVEELTPYYYGDTITADDIAHLKEVEGYDFVEWKIGSTSLAEDFTYEVTKNLQIRGYFSVQKYNAIFDANGGAWLNGDTERTVEVAYGSDITAPVEDPVREGYHLDPIMKWDPELGTMFDEDQTFYANWVPNEYTLTFIAEGEVIADDPQTYGEKIEAPEAPAKAGYDFAGWTTDGGSTIVKDLSTVDVPAADTTYTAVYVPSAGGVDYKVNRYFMNTKGEYEAADTITLHAVAETEVTYDAEFDGFTLNTAHADSVLTAVVKGDGTTVLEVYYDRNKVTVNVNGTEDEYFQGEEIELPDAPEEEGKTFDHWVDENGNTVTDPYVVPNEEDKEVTLTPVYTNNEYTATFIISAEGTSVTYTTTKAKYTESVVVPADPTAEVPAGYIFKGWAKTEGATEALADLGNMPVNGITFYAVLASETDVEYTIEKYFMGLDKTYAIDATKTVVGKDGTAGAEKTLTLDADEFEGFTLNTAHADSVLTAVVKGDGTTVFKAYYDRDTVKVTINGNETEKFYGEEINEEDMPAHPTAPEGMEPDGWVDGNGDPVEFPVKVGTEDIVIEPNYKASEFVITFMNGDAVVQTGKQTYGEILAVPADPSLVGHSFDGWYANGVKVEVGTTTVPAAATSYEAKFNPNNYTVTFTADGEVVATGDYAYGTKISTILPAYTAPAGYEFAGWSLDGVTVINFTDDVTVPVDGITYVAVINEVNSAYIVETYVMNVNGQTYAKSTETLYALTGTVINYTADEKTGFTLNTEKSELSKTVTGDGQMRIKVYYDRDKYEITVNGETNEYYYGEEIPAPVAPEKEGYTFDKWENVTTGEEVTFPYVVSEDDDNIAIVPKYTANEYTVTFKVRGTTYATGSYDYGTAVVDPGTPNVPGYTFGGWAKNGTVVDLATETVPVNGVVYTAVLTANTDTAYTVNKYFQSTDGHTWSEADAEVRYATTGATVTIVAEDETVEGFTVSEIYPESATIAGDGSTTFEIYYTRNLVEITINGDKDEYFYGEEIAAPAEPSKEGYTFTGWVDEDGNTVTFPFEATEDLVIVPVFEANTVSLSFVVDNVALEGYPTTAVVDSTITAPAAPKKDGYNFVDWYIQGTNIAFNGKMPTADTVYEARYTAGANTKVAIEVYTMNTAGAYEKTVTYTFGVTDTTTWIEPSTDLPGLTPNYEKSKLSDVVKADGSTVLAIYYDRDLYTVTWVVDGKETTDDVYYGAAIVVPAAPVKDGYTFTGWTPAVPATMPEGDLEFTAQWDASEYKVIYVENGKVTTETYAYGATVTVKEAAEVEGMTFNGWIADNAEYAAGETFTMPANDVIIVADYVVSVYKVTFLNADGSVFATEMVKCGDEIPVPEAEPTKDFSVFKGWNMIYTTMPEMNITVEPIFEKIPVKLVPQDGSTTVIDRDINVITGLKEYITKEETLRKDFLKVEGDGFMVITPVAAMQYGTGTVVELYDNDDPSEPIETYVIVVYGDLNGDSAIQAVDSTWADDEGLMLTNWSEETVYDAATGTMVANPNYDPYKVMAADLNGDGIIDAIDATIIGDASIFMFRINQVTGRPE